MPTTRIELNAEVVTLINIFETTPDKQTELIRLLEQATEDVMMHQPGFVSANIHKGLDGKHVANYAQWSSVEDMQRMLEDPEAQAHMDQVKAIAKAEPQLYRVVSVHR